MCQLSEELAKPMIESRCQNLKVMRHYSTNIAIECVIGRCASLVEATPGPSVVQDASERKKIFGSCCICYKQAIRKRRKTKKSCSQCDKPVCDEHSSNFIKCLECSI